MRPDTNAATSLFSTGPRHMHCERSVPQNCNCRKIAAFKNHEVQNSQVLVRNIAEKIAEKAQKNRRKPWNENRNFSAFSKSRRSVLRTLRLRVAATTFFQRKLPQGCCQLASLFGCIVLRKIMPPESQICSTHPLPEPRQGFFFANFQQPSFSSLVFAGSVFLT